jgi:hypothetical protein
MGSKSSILEIMQLATQEPVVDFCCCLPLQLGNCNLLSHTPTQTMFRRPRRCGWDDGGEGSKMSARYRRASTEPHDLMADDEKRANGWDRGSYIHLRDLMMAETLLVPPIKPSAAATALPAASCAQFRSDAGHQEEEVVDIKAAIPPSRHAARLPYHPGSKAELSQRNPPGKRASPPGPAESVPESICCSRTTPALPTYTYLINDTILLPLLVNCYYLQRQFAIHCDLSLQKQTQPSFFFIFPPPAASCRVFRSPRKLSPPFSAKRQSSDASA